MSVILGIDIGGSTTKIVGLRRDGSTIAMHRVQAQDPITSLYGALGNFLFTNGLALSDVFQIALTGVGYKFINFVTMLAGDSLLLLMICLMITSMILGMGVPTTPAYIIVATLGVPALVKFGVTGLAAHMFVFYYAILACITPPVCIAAFAGASIAEAKAMETGWLSAKLGIVAFIIPFMFIYEPALLLAGNLSDIILASISALVGVVALSGGLQGYLLTRASLPERLILTAGGLCLIYPGMMTDLSGLGALVLVLAIQASRRRHDRPPHTAAPL